MRDLDITRSDGVGFPRTAGPQPTDQPASGSTLGPVRLTVSRRAPYAEPWSGVQTPASVLSVGGTGDVMASEAVHPAAITRDARPGVRCCPSHPDWPTLAQHLMVQYTDIGSRRVVDAVRRAREAAELAALTDADALETGEAIARHQLALLSGVVEDIARLDPQQRVGDSVGPRSRRRT